MATTSEKPLFDEADAHVHVGAHRPRAVLADGHDAVGRQQSYNWLKGQVGQV